MLKAKLELGYRGFGLSISLEVGRGQFWGLVGASGVGKSTLLSALVGLHRPKRGELILEGRTLYGQGLDIPPYLRQIGYLTQEPSLFPHLTVRENLNYGRVASAAFLADLVASLNLAELLARRPAQLSGGQKSRVALGRALAPLPSVLLLDEPFAALDWVTRRRLGTVLADLQRRQGFTVIMSTHDLEEITGLCSHLAVLGEGRVLAAGQADFILRNPGSAGAAQALGYRLVPGPGGGLLAFHPADLQIGSGESGISLMGRVMGRVPGPGESWRLALDLGGEVVVNFGPVPAAGTQVTVWVPADRCHVY